MSTKAVSWAIHHFKVDNPQVKLILILLAENANEDGVCWPSQVSTAEKAGCSVITVKRVQKLLEAEGVIEVMRKQVGEQKTRNRYRLRIEQGFDIVTKKAKTDSKGIREIPSKKAPSTDQQGGGTAGIEGVEGIREIPSESVEGVAEIPSKVTERDLQKPEGITGDTFEGITAVIPEPSYNHHLNPSNTTGRSRGLILNRADKYPMTLDWQPSAHVVQKLAVLGTPPDFTLAQLDGYRTYWLGNGSQHQGAWDAKFLKHVKYNWETRPRDKSQGDAVARMTDRSWAEGIG